MILLCKYDLFYHKYDYSKKIRWGLAMEGNGTYHGGHRRFAQETQGGLGPNTIIDWCEAVHIQARDVVCAMVLRIAPIWSRSCFCACSEKVMILVNLRIANRSIAVLYKKTRECNKKVK